MPIRTDRPQMRPFGGLASWQQACATATALTAGVARRDTLPLTAAAGRVLGAPAVASVDVPSSDRAAMDGYALRAAEARPGALLPIAGRVAAGGPPAPPPPPGACIEVATGATLPAGTDAVVPVENTRRDGDRVVLRDAAVATGQHIARQGEDLRRGGVVGREGDALHPALLAACAAGGIASVSVWSRPRVLIAPTGDEVVPLGTDLAPGRVFDSNAAGLQALVAEVGGEALHAGIILDDVAALVELLRAGEHDLLVTVGGTSVGRRDLVAEAVRQVGETLVHGVAVKPGKPLLLGRVGERPVVGLPGFPTTCMMLGYALLDPMLRRLAHRRAPRHQIDATLDTEVHSPDDKVQLLPVALEGGQATPTFSASSSVSSMAHAHGWIEIPVAVTRLEAGSSVRVTLF